MIRPMLKRLHLEYNHRKLKYITKTDTIRTLGLLNLHARTMINPAQPSQNRESLILLIGSNIAIKIIGVFQIEV